MADLNDLQRIACSLPGVEQEEGRIAYAVLNKGKRKGFAWVWMERIDPKKARVPNLEVIAIRVRNELEKEALIAEAPTKFFTEAHYNGFPAILVRLAAVESLLKTKVLTPELAPLHSHRYLRMALSYAEREVE